MTGNATNDLVCAILNFRIDSTAPSFRFVDRLARENFWSLAYAEKVVQEYKKFLALAAVLPHSVTPSEDVDQAWHLHLTFTDSYWRRLCQETIGRPLHHHPTRGGETEKAKFVQAYEGTLEAYETMFQTAPPKDIWPPSQQRFANVGASRWIDTSGYWVLNKRSVRRTAGSCCLMTAVLGGTRQLHTFAFQNMDGPTYLSHYAAWSVVCIALSLLIRTLWSRVDPHDVPVVDNPIEVALLANGPSRAILAALAALIHRRSLIADDGQSLATLVRGEATPGSHSRLEQRLYEAVDPENGSNIDHVIRTAESEANLIRDHLREQTLIPPDPSEPWQRRGIPWCIMAALAVAGLARISEGISREKPVTWLVMMLIGVLTVWYFLCRRGRRTPKGNAAYANVLKRTSELRDQTRQDTSSLTTADFTLLVAIEGLRPLVGYDDTFVHVYRRAVESSAGDGGCGGCAGCGGCGGCGCGGCG